jgi:FKBP-type peptidyl-prolyl cis-trans isomerase FklB
MMIIRWMAILAVAFSAVALPAQDETSLKNPTEKLSYALGMDLGNQFRKQTVQVNPEVFLQGLKDAIAGSKTLLTEEQVRSQISELQNQMRTKYLVERATIGRTNKSEGEAFLAGNKSQPGVIALESGLQYRIIKAGDGQKPSLQDTVLCNYRGTLINGTEFDNSYKQNKPASFPVAKVIKGWTEALQRMPVGSKWQLFVPPSLAYGENGAGSVIGPNATLIFEVDLVAIQPKSQTADAREGAAQSASTK